MTIETTRPVAPEDDVIDVEEVGRLDQLKTAAKARTVRATAHARVAMARQREVVFARVGAWFATTDVTDARLAQEIETKRRKTQQQGETELRARIRVLREKLRHAEGDQATGLAIELAGAESQIQLRQDDDADRFKVTGRDLGRARWGKKAGRLGAVALGGFAYLNGVAAEPLLALASLGAGPLAWWYLSRPVTEDEKQAVIPAQAVGHDGAVLPAAEAPDTGTPFVPDALAAMGRVSLIKPESGRVQGEKDLVTALIKAGIVSEAQRDETHLAGVIQPSGPGWTATVELPRGTKASVAVSRVEDLASALRIKKSRIEISADTSDDGHEGRFVLWVANEDNPYGNGKHPSELIAAPVWDFWQQGVPLGADARRDRHTMHLLWSSLMIGGLMGYGKSYLARLVAAAAALDPTVRIIVLTGKTGPDWAPLRHIAHQWIAGATPDIIRRVLGVMEQTIGEMQDRGTELDRLYEEDPAAVPEGKITPELAKKGMGPVLLVVDELQELLDGAALVQVAIEDEPEGGGRPKTRSGRDLMVEAFARYVRVTRFVGGMGVFITQRPSADSVPTKLREVCAKRASYRVKGDKSSKMVLGDDAVDAGAAPHLLGEASKGVVVLDQGSEQGHVTLKADVIDLPEFRDICLRGRDLRITAGTLTGDAAEYGKEDAAAAAVRLLLADCLTVLDQAGVDRARTERLVELLAEHHPGRYGDLTRPQLQARLRDAAAGTTRKLGAIDGMANPNGYTREQIAEAHGKTGK
ncbi:hypothetical protein SLUN_19445 [Streptomyces lunaelactis]|uniref:Cell division protein FtsK n=1 Tax=Streptomyces lunaelactis TaxID=1535768 RepID=A0A2R4T4H0_9ACTN|nr:hypothetical protein [Streptomyces lunaelactis]AVZ74012.1 hypothetical protein SLUN_19445 [Streptomyces lunaelactis]NUK85182.1 hypothetical protein [Streptomyces lunaelactis]